MKRRAALESIEGRIFDVALKRCLSSGVVTDADAEIIEPEIVRRIADGLGNIMGYNSMNRLVASELKLDFMKHGADAIRSLREAGPTAYLQVCSAFADGSVARRMTVDELEAMDEDQLDVLQERAMCSIYPKNGQEIVRLQREEKAERRARGGRRIAAS